MTSCSNRLCACTVDVATLAMPIPITSARRSRRSKYRLQSKEMRSEDVNDCDDHEKQEQGHVKKMPETEETLVECKGRRLLDGGDMQRHEVCHHGKPPALNPSRLSESPALEPDHALRIGH